MLHLRRGSHEEDSAERNQATALQDGGEDSHDLLLSDRHDHVKGQGLVDIL